MPHRKTVPLLAIALFILLAAPLATLQAQDDLTLEGLNDRLKAVESTVADLTSGLRQRVQDLEDLVQYLTPGLGQRVQDLEDLTADYVPGLDLRVQDLELLAENQTSDLGERVQDLENLTADHTPNLGERVGKLEDSIADLTPGLGERVQELEYLAADLTPGLGERVQELENLTADLTPGLSDRVQAIEFLIADPWSPAVIHTTPAICQSPLHAFDASTSAAGLTGQIHQETADAYRAAFGISIDPSDVRLQGIAFETEGNAVYLQYLKDDKLVVEKWVRCQYAGHSDWEPAEQP